jgi:hypothetical protein
MNYSFEIFTKGQEYLLLLALIMGLSFSAKKTQVFTPVYRFVAKRIKSKRVVVAVLSTLSGVLPINGRCSVSAGALDTLAPHGDDNKKKRANYGVIDYLSTHHYYFWSPLEATVLVPMATLGITYRQFMGRIWPLLVTAVFVILYYIFRVLKEEDIEISFSDEKQTASWQQDKKQIMSYARTLVFVFAVIVLGNFAKANADTFNSLVNFAHERNLLVLTAFGGFLASFALGSSGKFAGITALSTSIFGIQYLPLFFAIDYAGYMLSPSHKCLSITKSYFGTPSKDHYRAVLALVVPVMCVGILAYLTAGG